MEVKGRDRPPRAFPRVAPAGDENDRPVEPLDETGCDDPDHALVPVRPGEDVCTAAAQRVRPPRSGAGPPGGSRPRPPAARGSASPARRRAGRLLRVVGEQQLERHTGMPQPAGSVDARSEAKAHSAGVHGGGIDAGRTHQRCEPGRSVVASRRNPPATSPGSRRRAGRRRPRSPARRGRASPRRRAERLASLKATPVRRAQGTGSRRVASRRRGSPGSPPARWWSLMTTSSPSAFAPATSSTAVMPQSTVRTRPHPLAAIGLERLARQAVSLGEPARQVPPDIGAEGPQSRDGKRGRTDAVHVVVAVHADALPPATAASTLSQAARMSPSKNGS